MIITTADRDKLPAKFAMVGGCFDPVHRGHVEYFELARAAGLPLLCNVQSDEYMVRHKGRPALLPLVDRLAVINGLRAVDFVCVAENGTAATLRHFRPTYHIKGADWRDRLPAEEINVCNELGIEIVYVDCPRDSSSRILQTFLERSHVRRAG